MNNLHISGAESFVTFIYWVLLKRCSSPGRLIVKKGFAAFEFCMETDQCCHREQHILIRLLNPETPNAVMFAV
jgi:hypothetical protein